MDPHLIRLITWLEIQLACFDIEIEGGVASCLEDVLEQLERDWPADDLGCDYCLPDSIEYDDDYLDGGLNLILKWDGAHGEFELEVVVGYRDDAINEIVERILENIPK